MTGQISKQAIKQITNIATVPHHKATNFYLFPENTSNLPYLVVLCTNSEARNIDYSNIKLAEKKVNPHIEYISY